MPEVISVICPRCKRFLYKDERLRARYTDFKYKIPKAKCPYCKIWVNIPPIKKRE